MKGFSHRWIVGLLLAVHLVLCLASSWDKTLTRDEPAHLSFGRDCLINGRVERVSAQKMPISAVNALPGLALETLGLPKPPGRAGRLLDRAPTTLASLILGLLVFIWSRRISGAAAGLASLTLYVFCPTVIANGRLVTNDLYTAMFTFLTCFLLWRFCTRPGWGRLLAAGAVLGVALACKYSAVAIFPALAIALVFPSVRRPLMKNMSLAGHGRGKMVLMAIGFAMMILVALNGMYGFSGSCTPLSGLDVHSPILTGLKSAASWLPVPLPACYLLGLDLSSRINEALLYRGYNYFLGELSAGGWWYYFLVLALVKIPLGTILFMLLAASRAVFRRRAGISAGRGADSGRLPVNHSPFLWLPALAVFVFFSFISTVQIGFRYMLPVLPMLYVLAGSLLSNRPDREPSRPLRRTSAVLLAATALSTLLFFPHYLAYSNVLLQPKHAAYRLMANSNLDWRQDHGAAKRFAGEHPGTHFNPECPVSGEILVGANHLVGVADPDVSLWLREHFEPYGHFRHSHLRFRISQDELENALGPVHRLQPTEIPAEGGTSSHPPSVAPSEEFGSASIETTGPDPGLALREPPDPASGLVLTGTTVAGDTWTRHQPHVFINDSMLSGTEQLDTLRWTGYLRIRHAGVYSILLDAARPSCLRLCGAPVIDHPGEPRREKGRRRFALFEAVPGLYPVELITEVDDGVHRPFIRLEVGGCNGRLVARDRIWFH